MAGAEARNEGLAPDLVIDGAVATITLRRPAVANRLELSDLEVLHGFLADVNARPEVLLLRLQGEGRHFCSGFNIGQVGTAGADAGRRFEGITDAVEQARPITVAVLQGGAFGGAGDLAVACDFRIGGPDSELMVPAARLGLHFYRGGLERFVAAVGLPAARRIMLAAERLDATEMRRLGLLDRVADSTAGVPALVDAFCAEIACLAPLAILGMKQHLNRIARGTLDAAALARDIAAADASADLKEGAAAWQQRRPPQFQGR
jgi:enoyl-CoA hydratase/carnithine racemase